MNSNCGFVEIILLLTDTTLVISIKAGLYSVAGTAIRYGVDGPGIESACTSGRTV
jgi:hypothetical protein